MSSSAEERRHRGPILVVAACIVRRGAQEILLARRNQPALSTAHLLWELPGGKVELGETPQQALYREIREELDADIRIIRLLPHLQTNIYHKKDGSVRHYLVIAFECVQVLGETATIATPSHSEIAWFNRDDVAQMSLLPGTLHFVRCLARLDEATHDEAHFFVRLHKKSGDVPTDYWDFQCIHDLWGDYNLVERHVNLLTRSTHTKLFHAPSYQAILRQLLGRVRSLASHGYSITHATHPLFEEAR